MKPQMNTARHSRNQTKVLRVFFACFAVKVLPMIHREERQEREDFAKKNPLQPGEDFSVKWQMTNDK